MKLDLGLTRQIIAEAKKRKFLRNELAYCLAIGYHESAFTMQPIKETVMSHHKDKNPSDATVISRLNTAFKKGLLGNVKNKYWLDGHFGRGLVQITHEANYNKFGITKEDALKPDVAIDVLLRGMKDGMFTGKRLSQYITLQSSNFFDARDIVNGDKNYTPKGAKLSIGRQIEQYAKQYDALLEADGYGVESKQEENEPEWDVDGNEKSRIAPLMALVVVMAGSALAWLSSLPCSILGVMCGG